MAKGTEGSAARKKTKGRPTNQVARKRPRKKRPVREPETPVLSGRLMVATGLLAAMALIPFLGLGKMLEPEQDAPTDTSAWEVGKTARVHVTLITADYNKLSCYSDQVFQGNHCQFETETQGFRRDPGAPLDDNKKDIIQPYRTHGSNKLIFIAGLWADPALATRLHFEPPRGVSESKLARFVADCEVEFIGKMKNPGIRWSPSGKWIHEGDPLVAIPKHCNIPDPAQS